MGNLGSNRTEPPPEEGAGQASPGVGDGIAGEVRDALAHIRRRRNWVLAGTLVMAALGVILASVLPRLYVATAQVLVDPRGLRVFENEVVPGGQISDVQSALIESQARILRSDTVLGPVVAEQHLASDPEFDGEPRNAVLAVVAAIKAALLHTPPADRTAMALSLLGDAVKVQRVSNSFVLELTVASRDAEKAARLAQSIITAYIAEAQQSREDTARRVSEGLAQRLDALGGEVQRAETAVDTFKRQNNIVDTNGRPLNEQELGNLTNQLTAARVRTAELRSRVDQIARIQRSGVVPDATVETVQSNAITALRNRYAEIKQRRDSLLTSLGPRHPDLLAATAQLDGVRNLIAQEIARIAASARADLERAQTTDKSLAQQVAAVNNTTSGVNTATIRLRELEREAAARRAVYESFLNRSRETREQADLPTVNIAVISPPAVPLTRGGLPAPVVIALVAAFGASAAALAALALDRLNGRLMTPRQMSVATGLPLLVVVRRRVSGMAGLIRRRTGRMQGEAATESVRALHRAVADAAPDRPPRIVLLLSATPSVSALALPLDLAQAGAEAGETILLVDADEDRLTRPFGSEETERRGWAAVRPTPIRNLSVLAWSAPFIGASAPDGRGGASALRQFSADHDLVLIHGPLGKEAVRIRPLAAIATTIVLLADAEVTTVSDMDAIRQELGAEAVKVAGFAWVTREALREPRRPSPGGRDGQQARLEVARRAQPETSAA